MCSRFIRYRIFMFTNLAHTVGSFCLSSLSSNPQETHMALRKDQVVPATNAKNNMLAASGGTLGVTTQSKARALSVVPSILPNEQEHPSHEPVITLTSLRAPKEKSPKRYFESTVEEKDLQIATLINQSQKEAEGGPSHHATSNATYQAFLLSFFQECQSKLYYLLRPSVAINIHACFATPEDGVILSITSIARLLNDHSLVTENSHVGKVAETHLMSRLMSSANSIITTHATKSDIELVNQNNPAGTPNQQNEVNGRQVETVVTDAVRQAETVDSPVDCLTRELKVAAVKPTEGSSNPAETANPQNEVTGTQVEIGVTVNIKQQDNPDLPFVKSYPEIWEKVESMDAFKRYPQKPHFYPLVKCGELSRESLAVAKMLTFASLVEKTSKLNIEDPGDFFDSIFEELGDLETFGFDVKAVRDRLNSLIDIKVQLAHVQDKSKEVQIKIAEQTQDRKKHNEIICGVGKQIKDLQDQLVVLMSEDAAKGSEISRLQSEADAITESIQSIRRMTHWLKHGDPCESILLITALSTETELKVIPS
ncbi:hypothetical protein D8674_003794 [Pyrus ussuriensis x Pyrus communis]|uniref:Uncharacterized protein n=1 Tax=Pyrus ussuriensis x Pyrus communis TaxID=2448454 RepID=A0A5N5FI19_9ROSA|nr:hypothetical protein D8674_003794 [Pyrus ussuriensis x Pyrus communis]